MTGMWMWMWVVKVEVEVGMAAEEGMLWKTVDDDRICDGYN